MLLKKECQQLTEPLKKLWNLQTPPVKRGYE